MRSTRTNIREDFERAARKVPEGQVITFSRIFPPPSSQDEPLIKKQYRLQRAMLDAMTIMGAHDAANMADLSVTNQNAAVTNPVQGEQAAAQEKGGSIFSKGYSRFFIFG